MQALRGRSTVCFLWITAAFGASVAAENLLFKLVADVGPTVRRVEAPGSVFARGTGLAKILFEAGVAQMDHPVNEGMDEIDPRVGRLLVKATPNPDIRLEHGETPLMQAVRQHLDEAVQLLLDKGADVNLRDSRGRTALMHAVMGENLEAVALLLSWGADPSIKDGSGATPQEKARAARFTSAFAMLTFFQVQ